LLPSVLCRTLGLCHRATNCTSDKKENQYEINTVWNKMIFISSPLHYPCKNTMCQSTCNTYLNLKIGIHTIAGQKNSYSQNFSIGNQSLQRQTLLSVSKSMQKNGFNQNSKKDYSATFIRDGISIRDRAIAAEVVFINVPFDWSNKKSNLCIHNLY
jgi:hypothetical protein